jgi:hypothetical protein
MLGICVSSVSAQTSESQTHFGIYYQVTSGGSSYVNAGGETYNIGGSGGATFCYIPDLNTTSMVPNSKYVSFSYSPVDMYPYTVDDRLFLVYDEMPQSSSPGQESVTFTEINPASGTEIAATTPFSFYETSSYAVVGNSLYFQPGLYYDMFHGKWVGQQLMMVNLDTSKEVQLLAQGDPDNYGTLVSAAGSLFRYQFKNAQLTINQIDLGTGKIAKGVQLGTPSAPNNMTFSQWHFAVDENSFYVVAQYSPNGASTPELYLWTIPRLEFDSGTIPNGPSDYWFNAPTTESVTPQPFPPINLIGVQACHGKLLLNLKGSTMLYDTSTGQYSTIPGAMSGAQVLYGAETQRQQQAQMSPSFRCGLFCRFLVQLLWLC